MKKARFERAFSIGMCGGTAPSFYCLVLNNFERFLSSAHDHHAAECRSTQKEEEHA